MPLAGQRPKNRSTKEAKLCDELNSVLLFLRSSNFHSSWKPSYVNVCVLAAVFSRKLLKKIISRRGRPNAELNRVDTCPWIELTDQTQFIGPQLRLVGVGKQKNDIRPHLQRRPQCLHVIGRTMGKNTADKVRRQPLAR